MRPDTDPREVDTQPIDVLLDGSAPHAPTPDSTSFAAMIADARREGMPRRMPRAGRIAAGAGLAVLLTGGASAALAGGLFQWSGWAAEPDIAYGFTLPSGRQCEERILIDDAPSAGDGVATPSAVGAALRQWARSADFATLVDVPAELAALDPADGIPLAPKQADDVRVLPDPDGPDAVMVVLRAEGGLDVVPKTTAGPTADDLYANAVDRGLWHVLERKGTQLGTSLGWSTSLQMQCEPAP